MKVFPVYYLPPISWFAALRQSSGIVLEAHEHYRKQQYFNRARIKGPNGVQSLSIPIVKAPEKTPIHTRRIAYQEDWQKNHWKSLEAGYRSSPYFEFYEDRFAPFYQQKWESLLEFNLEFLKVLFPLLDLEVNWTVSEQFFDADHYEEDFRPQFNARKVIAPSAFQAAPYQQVFPGFEPDLSIIDLLCNEGPATHQLLRDSWKAT